MERNNLRCRCRCADAFCNMDDVGDAEQRHVHEFAGNAQVVTAHDMPHTHHMAGISGPAIPIPGGHIHRIATRTDFFAGHYHAAIRETGPAIPVGDGTHHVHDIVGDTTVNLDHQHPYHMTTLIDDPAKIE